MTSQEVFNLPKGSKVWYYDTYEHSWKKVSVYTGNVIIRKFLDFRLENRKALLLDVEKNSFKSCENE